MMCNVKPKDESCELLVSHKIRFDKRELTSGIANPDIFLPLFQMTILLRMDDKMNRQLTCLVSEIDTSLLLAQELVHFGFINEVFV